MMGNFALIRCQSAKYYNRLFRERLISSLYVCKSQCLCVAYYLHTPVFVVYVFSSVDALQPSLDHRDPIRPQPRVLTHSCISFVMCFGIRKRSLSTGWQFLSSGRLACDWSDSVEFEQRSWNLSFEQRSWNLSFQSRSKLKRRLEIRTARLKSFQSWLK